MGKRFPRVWADMRHRGRSVKTPAEIKAAHESGYRDAIASAWDSRRGNTPKTGKSAPPSPSWGAS